MNTIVITVENAGLHAALRKLIATLTDTTPTMRALSEIMLDASERAFAKRANPASGEAWPALSASRLRQREKKGRSPLNILQDLGVLVGSVTGAGGAGAVRRIENNYVFIGTNVPYAAAHQFGAVIKRKAGTLRLTFGRKKNRHGKMAWGFVEGKSKRARYGMEVARGPSTITIPARPFLGVNDTDIRDMLDTVTKHLKRALGENSL